MRTEEGDSGWRQSSAATVAEATVAQPHTALTPAEQRVFLLLLDGLSNKEIASRLARAEATVKNQVAAVLRKYEVPSRASLLARLR